MTSDEFIALAMRTAGRLKVLDKRRVTFGSSRHRHTFEPPLSAAAVDEYELRYGVTLPLPYRQYLTCLGNGGSGPYYGVLPLDFSEGSVSEVFPHTEKFVVPDSAPEEELYEPVPGCIRLSEYGCGTEIVLVVNGASAGEVWWDARYETGLSPAEDDSGLRYHFDRWWLEIMEKHLSRFETILALMSARTSHDEIHRRLDSEAIQLVIDESILSIMDKDPTGTPMSSPDKPWGRVCGLVDDHYKLWLEISNPIAEQDAEPDL